MLNENQQHNMDTTEQHVASNQFGGHELFDVDETVGAIVGTIEHFVIYGEYVQDEELTKIMHRQKGFLIQIYNTILETLKSGQDPATKTQNYLMHEDNKTTFGLQPGKPKSPIESVTELNDECISGAILGHLKGVSTNLTTAALEASHPVIRRILADSIPNVIEMAYEIYLYQNKHQYYQVAQLKPQDAQTIINSYAPAQNNLTH